MIRQLKERQMTDDREHNQNTGARPPGTGLPEPPGHARGPAQNGSTPPAGAELKNPPPGSVRHGAANGPSPVGPGSIRPMAAQPQPSEATQPFWQRRGNSFCWAVADETAFSAEYLLVGRGKREYLDLEVFERLINNRTVPGSQVVFSGGTTDKPLPNRIPEDAFDRTWKPQRRRG